MEMLAIMKFRNLTCACLVFLMMTPQVAPANVDWKNVNLKETSLPSVSTEKVTVETKTASFSGASVSYRECVPESGAISPHPLWLLHGAAYSAETWVNSVPTVQTMCALGYRVVAINLPGRGGTKTCPSCDTAEFMLKVKENIIGGESPVIVSPSYSGSFSLPFLKEHQSLVAGFVPVAPTSTGSYVDFFPSLTVPTMIVYGDRDGGATSSASNLGATPTATQPQILKDAGHAAYLDQQETWHQLLYNFMEKLKPCMRCTCRRGGR